MRLDHAISQNHLLNFTYNYFDSNVFSPFAFGGASVPDLDLPTFGKRRIMLVDTLI